MKKKILFITNDFGMGGAEKLLIDIVGTLLDAHFDVDVLAFFNRGALKNEMRKLCHVYTLFDSELHFLIFRKLSPYRRFLVNNFVTTHGYDFAVGFMEGRPAGLLSDISVDVYKISWIHTDFMQLDIGLSATETRAIYTGINKIVCVSRDAEQSFIKKISPLPASSQVIYNLIDEDKVDALSRKTEIKNNAFTFLTVGMLRREKGHIRLVRIAARLKDAGYNFQMHIIGDGPLRQTLEELINQLQVGDRVALLGLKSNPYPYIKACDCFVLASDFEGYGIVIKEALFLKKLILTTDVVGPREILEDGKYGLLVDNNEDALFEKMKVILDGQNDFREIRANINRYRGDNGQIKQQLCELFL